MPVNQQSQQEPALEESRAKRGEQLEACAHCPAREKLVESVEEEAAGAAHLLRSLLVLVFLLYHIDDLNKHLLVMANCIEFTQPSMHRVAHLLQQLFVRVIVHVANNLPLLQHVLVKVAPGL